MSSPNRRVSSSTHVWVFCRRVAKLCCLLGGHTLNAMPVDTGSRCVREQVNTAAQYGITGGLELAEDGKVPYVWYVTVDNLAAGKAHNAK